MRQELGQTEIEMNVCRSLQFPSEQVPDAREPMPNNKACTGYKKRDQVDV